MMRQWEWSPGVSCITNALVEKNFDASSTADILLVAINTGDVGGCKSELSVVDEDRSRH